MMKKTILFNLFMLLFLVSCSSDSENDDLQKDELLSNTEWVYIDSQPSDQITGETAWNNDDFNKFLASLLYRFPSFAINAVIIDYIELNEEKTSIKNDINEEKLKFTDAQCTYSKLIQNKETTQTVKNRYKRMTIPSQECTNDKGEILNIQSDGIYLMINNLPEAIENKSLLLKLENNQYKIFSNLIEVISEKESTETKENTSLTFSFTRTENEIIMTNSTCKWFGILNKNNWTISVKQISPEQRDIRVFNLIK